MEVLHMKKILTTALSLALLLSTTACGLNPEAEALKQENEKLKEQLGVTETTTTEKPAEKSLNFKFPFKGSNTPYELVTGTYEVPGDIPAGKYDVKAISGKGYFFVTDNTEEVLDDMSADTEEDNVYISERKNLTLDDGCTIKIRFNLKVQLIPKD